MPDSQATVAVDVAVKPKVAVGPTSIAGGTVTLAAFVTAAIAFAQGARDEVTISVLAAGVVALVTTLGGRFWQAAVAAKAAAPYAMDAAASAAPDVDALGDRVDAFAKRLRDVELELDQAGPVQPAAPAAEDGQAMDVVAWSQEKARDELEPGDRILEDDDDQGDDPEHDELDRAGDNPAGLDDAGEDTADAPALVDEQPATFLGNEVGWDGTPLTHGNELEERAAELTAAGDTRGKAVK